MLVLIEGCDGTGKSTLADELAGEIRYLHPDDEIIRLARGAPIDHPLVEYIAALTWYKPGARVHVIADRWHWGEPIYGPLYRGKSELGVSGFAYVEMFLRSRGAVLAYLDLDVETVHARLVERGDDYIELEHVPAILDGYKRTARTSLLRTTAPSDPFSVVSILEAARKAEHQVLDLDPKYVGPPTPRLLFVDERPVSDGLYKTSMIPYSDTAGRYFLDTLAYSDLASMGLVSAIDVDLRMLVTKIRPVHVVALGRGASKVLTDLQIRHGAVPHPDDWRSRPSSDRVKYRSLISDAISFRGKVF